MATITSTRMTITITITTTTATSTVLFPIGISTVGGLGILTLVSSEVELKIDERKRVGPVLAPDGLASVGEGPGTASCEIGGWILDDSPDS